MIFINWCLITFTFCFFFFIRLYIITTFTIFSKGEEIIDPDTGIALGADEKRIGAVRITRVEENYSVGETKGSGSVKTGDVVR